MHFYRKLKSYHSWSSGEGIRPAVPFFEFSSLPCHQLWSSLLMIWIISPTRNLMPASLQGMRSSFAGSYSNCALTYIYKKGVYKRHCNIITSIVLRVTGENFIRACSYTHCLQQAKEETEWQKHNVIDENETEKNPSANNGDIGCHFQKLIFSTRCKTWAAKLNTCNKVMESLKSIMHHYRP